MTTRRQQIIHQLTQARAPGLTADQLARAMDYSLDAVMMQIKKIRHTHTVLATPHKHDARIKHYRIKPAKGDDETAAPAQPEKAAAPRTEPRQDLSATELEDAICTALSNHAGPRRPMDMEALCDHVHAPHALVRPAVISLVQRETVMRIKGGYHLPEAAKPTLAQAIAGPRVVEVMKGHYNGAELRPFDGRPGAMDAYRLPSRGMGV